MAPVLFLFLMAAISQVIEQEFEQNSIEKIEFLRKSDDKYHEGQIFRHDVKKCVLSENLTQVVVRHLAYVDDEGFPFTSRQQLALGTNIINRVFKMFGVEMHTGKRDSTTGKFSKSKTEAVYFPRRLFWKQAALSAGVAEEDAAAITLEDDNEPETQRERRQNTELAIYAAHPDTQPIVLEGGNERICSLSTLPTLDVYSLPTCETAKPSGPELPRQMQPLHASSSFSRGRRSS